MVTQGAGNVFKGEEAEYAKHASNDNAIDDNAEVPGAKDKAEVSGAKDKAEGLAAKGKALFFGKKDKQ